MSKIKKKYIYKICTIDEWKKASSKKFYLGNKVDVHDKYIHFSTAEQLEDTLHIHFLEFNNLILLKVSTKDLNIKWERSRNEEQFPHLYYPLNIKNVISVIELKKGFDGVFNIKRLKLE